MKIQILDDGRSAASRTPVLQPDCRGWPGTNFGWRWNDWRSDWRMTCPFREHRLHCFRMNHQFLLSLDDRWKGTPASRRDGLTAEGEGMGLFLPCLTQMSGSWTFFLFVCTSKTMYQPQQLQQVDIELYRADKNKDCLYTLQKSVKSTHREIPNFGNLEFLWILEFWICESWIPGIPNSRIHKNSWIPGISNSRIHKNSRSVEVWQTVNMRIREYG